MTRRSSPEMSRPPRCATGGMAVAIGEPPLVSALLGAKRCPGFEGARAADVTERPLHEPYANASTVAGKVAAMHKPPPWADSRRTPAPWPTALVRTKARP